LPTYLSWSSSLVIFSVKIASLNNMSITHCAINNSPLTNQGATWPQQNGNMYRIRNFI
jgi:hypothetical protein